MNVLRADTEIGRHAMSLPSAILNREDRLVAHEIGAPIKQQSSRPFVNSPRFSNEYTSPGVEIHTFLTAQ